MTTLADPVPGGRPGDHDRATERAAELKGHGVTAVALSWVDTAGINRIKAVPLTALDRAAAWGVGMSPVFDTFLADDSIVATDVLGGPDGDLRLYPDLDGLVLLAGQPGWAWAPVDRITQDGTAHPACTRTLSPVGDHIGLIATGSVGAILTLASRANSWTQVVGPSARTTTTRVPSDESASSL